MDGEAISKELLDVLACPDCRVSLEYSEDGKSLKCRKCSQSYPVRNGIPILLPKDLQ